MVTSLDIDGAVQVDSPHGPIEVLALKDTIEIHLPHASAAFAANRTGVELGKIHRGLEERGLRSTVIVNKRRIASLGKGSRPSRVMGFLGRGPIQVHWASFLGSALASLSPRSRK